MGGDRISHLRERVAAREAKGGPRRLEPQRMHRGLGRLPAEVARRLDRILEHERLLSLAPHELRGDRGRSGRRFRWRSDRACSSLRRQPSLACLARSCGRRSETTRRRYGNSTAQVWEIRWRSGGQGRSEGDGFQRDRRGGSEGAHRVLREMASRLEKVPEKQADGARTLRRRRQWRRRLRRPRRLAKARAERRRRRRRGRRRGGRRGERG